MRNNVQKLITLALLTALALSLAACASKGGNVYSSSEERRVQTVQYGVVADVRTVQVDDEASGVGAVLGGVAGGVIGNLFGSGSGRTMATIGGAAAGAIGGYAGERALRRHEALEITVLLDDGRQIIVVQDADDYYNNGDRVRVVYGANGAARIQHQ